MTAGTSEKLTYSVPEAAQVLGMHPNTVRRYVAAGVIPAMRLGRRTLISVEELRSWVRDNARSVITTTPGTDAS